MPTRRGELAQRLHRNEEAVARLAGVAMNPSMRAFIACAKSDLRIVAQHAQGIVPPAEFDTLDRCIASIERQLELATRVIEVFGPTARPPTEDTSAG